MKSSFSIKNTKTERRMTYRGDLKEAIAKAKEELDKKQTDKKRQYLLWKYDEAKREYERWERRIKDLQAFVAIATAELAKKEEEEVNNEVP